MHFWVSIRRVVHNVMIELFQCTSRWDLQTGAPDDKALSELPIENRPNS